MVAAAGIATQQKYATACDLCGSSGSSKEVDETADLFCCLDMSEIQMLSTSCGISRGPEISKEELFSHALRSQKRGNQTPKSGYSLNSTTSQIGELANLSLDKCHDGGAGRKLGGVVALKSCMGQSDRHGKSRVKVPWANRRMQARADDSRNCELRWKALANTMQSNCRELSLIRVADAFEVSRDIGSNLGQPR